MAFVTGALVRAEFTGTVITAGGSRDGTSKVRGPDGRIHLLTLSNEPARRTVLANAVAFTRQPRYGSTVQVRLTGKVTGRPDTLLSGAQPVRADGYLYPQYLNPGSDYVQLANGAAGAPAAVALSGKPVPDGTKLDVSFTGTVVSRETGAYSTSPVRETGTGREHSLFLGDPSAREQLTGSRADLPKGATAQFTFTATALPDRGLRYPRRRVMTSDGARSWTHLLDTGSPSVTAQGAEKKEPEPAAAEPAAAEPDRSGAGYAEGDTVTVRFAGTVAVAGGLINGTALVREANGKEHYLYLPAALATPSGRQPAGTAIEVSFRARLRGVVGKGPGGRRTVTAIGPGFTHYLDMSSPSVRREGEAEKPAADLGAAVAALGAVGLAAADQAAAARTELAKRTSFRGDEVRDEIERLAGGLLTWAARRLRNGEVLKQDFYDKAEAEKWIGDNDYDPRRVEAVQAETGDPPPELAALRELDKLGESVTEDWAYGGAVVRGDQFTAAYAQGKFREDLENDYGVSTMDLGYWPLNLIDWDDAAAALRKDRESFEWAGQTWYSRN